MPARTDLLISLNTSLFSRPAVKNLYLACLPGISIQQSRYLARPFSKAFLCPRSSSNPSRTRCQRCSISNCITSSFQEGIRTNFEIGRPFYLYLGRSSRGLTASIAPHPASWHCRDRHPGGLRSGFQSWTAIFVLFILGGVVVFHQKQSVIRAYSREDLVGWKEHQGSNRDTIPTEREYWTKMTGEVLPGRPGNLTREQEDKLKEIWIATLRVFGVPNDQNSKESNGSGQELPAVKNQPASDAPVPEKPKKKRLSLFSRKHKDSDTESITSMESTSPGLPADSDDKFGQMKQFHDMLAHHSPEALRAAFWSMVKHDHPDALLLRFLRARKWDVEKALVMMVATMSWRATEVHVDEDIMRLGEEGALLASQSSNTTTKKLGEDFLAQMRMGKSFLHGIDKLGRPMCLVRVRLHKQGEQSEESLERYTVFVIETARMILAPPVDTACIMFDMTGFSLANMDYSPVKFMIKCFEANYPESLGVVLVHKAPWVFQGIWKIIRGWLDPVVASKVHFTNNVEEMEEFVSRNHIPKDFGGDENWSYEYIEPVAGENELMNDTVTRDKLLGEREKIVKAYEEATLDWIGRSNGADLMAIKEKRHELAASLKDDYWKLDPYVRARSMYDRIGVIQSGGKIDFYPIASTVLKAKTANGQSRVETSADDVE